MQLITQQTLQQRIPTNCFPLQSEDLWPGSPQVETIKCRSTCFILVNWTRNIWLIFWMRNSSWCTQLDSWLCIMLLNLFSLQLNNLYFLARSKTCLKFATNELPACILFLFLCCFTTIMQGGWEHLADFDVIRLHISQIDTYHFLINLLVIN